MATQKLSYKGCSRGPSECSDQQTESKNVAQRWRGNPLRGGPARHRTVCGTAGSEEYGSRVGFSFVTREVKPIMGLYSTPRIRSIHPFQEILREHAVRGTLPLNLLHST